MPRSITIRDVPDETTQELAARAAVSGRSLQEYLRAHLIAWTAQPDPAVLMARARARKERVGSEIGSASILSHRDAERR
jgi:plasmid stability protein